MYTLLLYIFKILKLEEKKYITRNLPPYISTFNVTEFLLWSHLDSHLFFLYFKYLDRSTS